MNVFLFLNIKREPAIELEMKPALWGDDQEFMWTLKDICEVGKWRC